MRAGRGTGRRPAAVTRCATPVSASPAPMIHGAVDAWVARSLIVERTGSNDACCDCARVHPPIIATGATTAETTAHHGTSPGGCSTTSGRGRGMPGAGLRWAGLLWAGSLDCGTP